MTGAAPGSEEGQVSLWWVVDYDVPADRRRKRFYRAVRRYLREQGVEEVSWSTSSVVFTADEEFARFVLEEAKAVGGRGHLYRAERLE